MKHNKAAGPENAYKDTGECPVTVKMTRDSTTSALQVFVSVRSKLRPTSLMQGTLPTDQIKSFDDIRHKVQVLAGALAEQLCERLGDAIDPDYMAKLAGEQWDDLLKQNASDVMPLHS